MTDIYIELIEMLKDAVDISIFGALSLYDACVRY